MIDFEKTIISQFANSPTICNLVRGMNEWIDPAADIQTFFDIVWNVDTAQGFGLDIWGKIVGVGRSIDIDIDTQCFGFYTGSDGSMPFGMAPFWSGEKESTVWIASDTMYRRMILTKALANISRCTCSAVNRLISNLFAGRGACWVHDLGDMRIKYYFIFSLLPHEKVIVDKLKILPRPAGVLQEPSLEIAGYFLGFADMGGLASPFGQAVFYH